MVITKLASSVTYVAEETPRGLDGWGFWGHIDLGGNFYAFIGFYIRNGFIGGVKPIKPSLNTPMARVGAHGAKLKSEYEGNGDHNKNAEKWRYINL